MKFEQKAQIPASPDKVWAFLMDVPKVASCVPGVEEVEDLGDDKYRGALKIRVGPIGLTLKGDIAITSKDEAAGLATMRAEAADKRVGGSVRALLDMTLTETSPGNTELNIVTDAQLMGKIGEFGQPIIRKKADQIMQEFATNLQKALTTGSPA
jgi:carbon monoxide dehydrogenase subunit G